MAIPESFLEDINARTDIVDLVSAYVPLQKKGNRYWGCCPFHSEKTPSFSVSPEKQMFYCFGCHKGGSAIGFVMEEEGVGFVDAVGILAQRAGLPMPETEENPGLRDKRERLLKLNKEAARYFYSNLSTNRAESGRLYFIKRGLSRQTITKFGLGYAYDQWNALIQAMAQKGYTKEDLLEAGLAVKSSEGRIYDRFRGRVMFPIIDLRGNVIGFGGRVLDDTTPKYLNSPDTIIYNKSRNLFAMNIVKKSKAGKIILTEGYMDTIALHQAGFDYAVASLGTSLTEEHARMLAKYAKEVIVAYDGDDAGISAAQRAIGLLNKTGVQVKVLKIAGAKDPDEFIKAYGSTAFQKLLDGAEGQMEYRLLQVQKKYDLTNDEQKVSYLQEAAELIARLQSPVEQEIYGRKAANAAGIDSAVMNREIARQRSKAGWRQRKQDQRKSMTPVQELQPAQRQLKYQNIRSALAEEGVIRLILLDSSLIDRCIALRPADFSSELLGRVYEMICQRWRGGKTTSVPTLESILTPEERNHLTGVLQKPESLANGELALADYITIIHKEHAKGQIASDADLLAVVQGKT